MCHLNQCSKWIAFSWEVDQNLAVTPHHHPHAKQRFESCGAWCAFWVAACLHFVPSAFPAPGRAEAGAVYTHPTLQVAGCSSGRNWEEEVALVWSQREERLSQKQEDHSNIPNQVMSSAAMSNISDFIIKFKTTIKVTWGQTGTVSSDQTTVNGEKEVKKPNYINAEGQLLCWPGPLLCYPKHGPLQRTWAPLARKEQRWGLGMGRKRVQLGDRGLLGGAQLAARVLTAVKHKSMSMERTHKHIWMSV